MDNIDCVVVGAGVVGLATARELALAGYEVVIVEAQNAIGSVTSARNSEVIHAGIYYAAGSLKAQLCVEGRALLYRYCEQNHIPHARCGKLIVATDAAQNAQLDAIAVRAAANGVHDLRHIDRHEAQELEPQLQCSAALLSPSTGIIDSHALMRQLLADAEAAGTMLALQSEIVGACVEQSGMILQVASNNGQTMELQARHVINAAGLAAPRLAQRITGLLHAAIPRLYFAKGNYFSLSGRSPFSRLIYPVPEVGGLGVHLTLDLGGQARFGPDVEWLDIEDDRQIDYRVDATRGERFYASIRRYWPQLADGMLQPGYSGVRPKLGRNAQEKDFLIQGPAAHGVSGLVNLFGIESPGLTASLAIARYVKTLLDIQGNAE
jgi:L-2-hydroxyglutarate oxidase LhgO